LLCDAFSLTEISQKRCPYQAVWYGLPAEAAVAAYRHRGVPPAGRAGCRSRRAAVTTGGHGCNSTFAGTRYRR